MKRMALVLFIIGFFSAPAVFWTLALTLYLIQYEQSHRKTFNKD